jgi:hypothetical protein
MKITNENYDEIKSSMAEFLNTEISRYVKLAGSRENLDAILGRSDRHSTMILKRQSFSALERLYKGCRNIPDKMLDKN